MHVSILGVVGEEEEGEVEEVEEVEEVGEDLATMNFAIVIFFSESSIVLPQRCSQDGCTIRRFDSRSRMNDGST